MTEMPLDTVVTDDRGTRTTIGAMLAYERMMCDWRESLTAAGWRLTGQMTEAEMDAARKLLRDHRTERLCMCAECGAAMRMIHAHDRSTADPRETYRGAEKDLLNPLTWSDD